MPESPEASGTVTTGPRRASRPNGNAPMAVPSEAIELTAPIVPVDSAAMSSSSYDSSTISCDCAAHPSAIKVSPKPSSASVARTTNVAR
jgi:hypothetical protein